MLRGSNSWRFVVGATCLAMTLLGGAAPRTLANGGASLLKDINSTPASSDPGPTFEFNGSVYTFGCFGSPTRAAELMLWKTDGTPSGTSLIHEINPCNDREHVYGPVTLGNAFYFISYTHLWRSDGTPEGTASIDWGLGHNDQDFDLTRSGSRLFFASDDWLMKSDGTTTSYLKTGITPAQLTDAAGLLMFTDKADGSLWKSNGTKAGTVKIKDPVAGASWITDMTAIGSRVFFVTGKAGATGGDLWVSNGTSGGTQRVKDIDPTRADRVSNLAAVGNTLFFRARDASHGYELWRSDGTAAGTLMVRNIRKASRSSNPADLINVSGILFFTATDGLHGRQLWKSDATTAGTVVVSSMTPLSDAGSVQQAAVGPTLYFSAQGTGGVELWKSDGTTAGTVRVEDINPSGDAAPRSLAAVGNELFFSADDSVSGRELWVSDGTSADTLLAADLNTAVPNARPEGLLVVGSTAYFAADDGIHGYELWKTDGTTAGTQLVKDIAPGAQSGLEVSSTYSQPWSAVSMGSSIFFAANDGARGTGLWTSDGTAAGTKMLSTAAPSEMTVINNRLVFVTSGGQKLWKSDGTKSGTKLIKSFKTVGDGSGWISELTSVGSRGYLAVEVETPTSWYPKQDFYLWRTDGTATGTRRVRSFDDYQPVNLTRVGNELFFTLTDTSELWKSNGTGAGTSVVKEMPNAWTGLQSLTAVGNKLFFTFDGVDSIPQLWVSDGSDAGTELVRQFPPVGGASSQPVRELTGVGEKLFFLADDDNGPLDLWVTDGTPDGTEWWWGFAQDPSGPFRPVGEWLCLASDDGVTGVEPWCVNGEPNGYVLLGDINAGDGSSRPSEFAQLGANVVFLADDALNGREFWSAPMPHVPTDF